MRTPGRARAAVPTHRSRHLRSLRAGRLRQVSRPLLRPSPPLRVLARIQQGTRTSKGDGSRPVARFLPRLSRRLRRSARHPAFTVPRPPPSRPLAIHSCAARTALRSSAGLSADASSTRSGHIAPRSPPDRATVAAPPSRCRFARFTCHVMAFFAPLATVAFGPGVTVSRPIRDRFAGGPQ